MLTPGSFSRIALIWIAATIVLVWFSADFARRKPSGIKPIPMIAVIVVSMANRIGAMLAPIPLLKALFPGRPTPLLMILFVVSVTGSLWINWIVVQLLQNLAYRLAGTKQQQVRWLPQSRREASRVMEKRRLKGLL